MMSSAPEYSSETIITPSPKASPKSICPRTNRILPPSITTTLFQLSAAAQAAMLWCLRKSGVKILGMKLDSLVGGAIPLECVFCTVLMLELLVEI
jgi:hypothetical protein